MKKSFLPQDLSRALCVIGALYAFWTATAFLLFYIAGFAPPPPPLPELIASVSIFFQIFLAALVTAAFLTHVQPVLESRHRLRIGMICLSAAFSGFFFLYARYIGAYPSDFLFILNTANLIVFANLVGTWMTVPLKRPAELVPVCLVMILADLFSVMRGPTRNVINSISKYHETGMQGPPPLAEFILVKVSVPGMDGLVSLFGVADWIMVSFFAAASLKFGINDNLAGSDIACMVRGRKPTLYFPVTALGLFVAVMMARYTGMFLPALPFMAVIYIIYILCRYPKALKLSRSDWLMTGGAAVVMCGLMVFIGLI